MFFRLTSKFRRC